MRVKLWVYGVVAVLAMALPAQAQTVNIGMIAPVTGPVASVGVRQLSTLQWWEHEVNAKGGINGHQVNIIHCDDAANPETAVTCTRDLLGKGVVLIINSSITGPIRATMPLVADGPVMLTPSPNIVPDPASFVFQVGPTDPMNTGTIARYMKKYGLKKIGVVAATDASGEVGVASVKSVFPAAGIPYTLDRIDLRANDASIQLSKVVQPDVDIIYVYYSGGGAATVVKSYANLGLTQPVILNYANMTDQFLALIKDDMPRHLLGTALKAISPDLLKDPAERERTTYFTHSYEAWKHEKADELNIAALGLADTAEAVLRNVANPRDAKAVKAYLETTPVHSFQTIRFSPTSHVGFTAEDVAMVEYKDGRWVEAGPIH